jgi:23S rRNA (guanosine2251-2'-O)-methyltransferase
VRLYGVHPVAEALRARRRPLHCLHLLRGAGGPERQRLEALAREAGVPIREEPGAGDGGPPGANTQGVILEAGPLPELSLEALAGTGGAPRTLVALDGVEDPQNVGAIVRVAEAAGVAGLILTRRRAPPLSPALARASAGAIEWLPVARVPNLRRALKLLKEQGFWVFGSAASGAVSLFDLPARLLGGNRVVVLGAEGRGLRAGVAADLDHCIAIPMAGEVASLNVSSAAAVLLFELRRRDSQETAKPPLLRGS